MVIIWSVVTGIAGIGVVIVAVNAVLVSRVVGRGLPIHQAVIWLPSALIGLSIVGFSVAVLDVPTESLTDLAKGLFSAACVTVGLLVCHLVRRKKALGYPPRRWTGIVFSKRRKARRLIRRWESRRGLLRCLVSPCDTLPSIGVAYLLVAVPYGLYAMLRWSWGAGPADLAGYQIIGRLISDGAGAPAFEETVLRWLPMWIGGTPVLLALSGVVWPLGHLAFRTGGIADNWPFALVLFAQGVFYVKVWRGRYYWLSFAIHSLTNLALIPVTIFVVRM